jgi:uncharacterized damage-inducible protein DinB
MAHYHIDYPVGLHPELGILFGSLTDGTNEWRESLETPSPEAIIWSPYPGGPSIGGVLLHSISAEIHWLIKVGAGQTPDDTHPARVYDASVDHLGPSWPVPPAEPIEWYFELQDKNREHMLEAVMNHNDPYAVHQGRTSTMTYRWILAHLVQHDSYHGGQAVLLHEMYKKVALR